MTTQKLLYKPMTAVWEITFACNMNCKHCGSSCDTFAPDELTTREALDLCDQLGKLNMVYITLSGGEPFLRSDWHEIAARLKKNNVIPNIITNGWLMDDQILDLAFEAGVANIAISLDGLEGTHDFIRKKGSFHKIMDALQLMKRRQMRAAIITTINKQNLDELPQMKEVLIRAGVGRWQVQIANPMGNFVNHQDLVIDPNDVDKIIDFAHDATIKQEIIVDIADCIGYYSLKDIEIRKMSNPSVYKEDVMGFWQGCGAGIYTFGIKCNGDIVGCTSIRTSNFVEDNIRRRSLLDIWNDPKSFAWNRNFDPDMMTGFCGECEYRKSCKGGCTTTKLTTNYTLHENLYCVYRNAVEKQKIRSLSMSKEALLQEAREHLEKKNYQIADIYLSRGLELDPNNDELLDLLGYVSYKLENFEKSRKITEKSIKICPDNAYAHKGLGNSLVKLGHPEEGLLSLRRAIALAPKGFWDPYYDLAVNLCNLGRDREALQAIEEGNHFSSEFKEKGIKLREFILSKSHPVQKKENENTV